MNAAWSVFWKELVDALRDRRTLLTVLLSSVAMGPLVLVLISTLVSSIEKRAEAREVVVAGLANAPTLHNYLLRQTYTVSEAPADYERQLDTSKLGDPVVVVPKDFEADLAKGEMPLVELVSSSANQRAEGSVNRIAGLLQGFNREQAALRLSLRGVSMGLLQATQVEQRDLANPAARAARLTAMLPFFVLMAVLYGALNAALDSTAGERERGSLEPLLMNPASRGALVLGKWGAVAAVAMLIALLSSFSFLPGQWLLRSETLAATFQYGLPEALAFLALLAPLAGALSALLMAIAIRCKTFKEAQASATVIVLVVSLLPMMNMINQDGEKPWHLWLPALAQSTLMNRVLRGEAITPIEWAEPLLACAGLTVLCLAFVARQFKRAAVR
ncbi:ABC transporter permease subunit [Ideonella azotifigens]|uniref:ABC transporter permease n=1 Tax=Ideonella azotifigens TaxID=513160 RepID=A0ABN1JPN4_9BURK|nr:ABC transporter permease subunit [Ideonella azotifigens]MCD2340074.1 ABC transporter permease subunit [Ideonella azotifigens]